MRQRPDEQPEAGKPVDRRARSNDLEQARVEFSQRIGSIRERQMIEHPERWPRRPFLCMTHRRDHDPTGGGLPRLGLLHADYPNCVFPVNLYDLPAYGGKMTKDEFLQRRIAYDTLDALLADWQVD